MRWGQSILRDQQLEVLSALFLRGALGSCVSIHCPHLPRWRHPQTPPSPGLLSAGSGVQVGVALGGEAGSPSATGWPRGRTRRPSWYCPPPGRAPRAAPCSVARTSTWGGRARQPRSTCLRGHAPARVTRQLCGQGSRGGPKPGTESRAHAGAHCALGVRATARPQEASSRQMQHPDSFQSQGWASLSPALGTLPPAPYTSRLGWSCGSELVTPFVPCPLGPLPSVTVPSAADGAVAARALTLSASPTPGASTLPLTEVGSHLCPAPGSHLPLGHTGRDWWPGPGPSLCPMPPLPDL